MKLNDVIKTGKISLTDKEKICLQAIRSEGSYFEESGGNDEIRDYGSCFFGYELHKDEDGGFDPRGPISSLVKKGVLNITKDEDGLAMYYLNYELDFSEDDEYHIIFKS